jgi:hypothetical protein
MELEIKKSPEHERLEDHLLTQLEHIEAIIDPT